MRILALALAAVLAACFAPSQHDPARFAPVRVALGAPLDSAGPWRNDERKELRAELVALGAFGPDFVETSEGDADLVWRPFDSTAADPQHRKCGAGSARFTLGADYTEIDPACCDGYDELRAAAGHETGHWLHLPHICQHGEADPSCDLSLGVGDALMNPSLAYQTDVGPEESAEAIDGLDVAQDRPTALDLAAFNRARARRARGRR